MRYRLRTLQVIVVVAAAPIWTLTTAVKHACPDRVMFVWGVLVAVPLILMGLGLLLVGREPAREQAFAFFGALVIVGYAIAIPGSLIAIAIPGP